MVSFAGEVTTITTKYVEYAGTHFFGINNDEPFATPNHLFWTTEGWKSLEPEAAREESPHTNCGVLADRCHSVSYYPDIPTTVHEPVTISQFTIITLSEPSKRYGLHLNDPQ